MAENNLAKQRKKKIYSQLIHKQNDNGQYWCSQIVAGVTFCIHVHVFEGRKLIPVYSNPTLVGKRQKNMTKYPCLDVNTHNRGDILSGLRGQVTDSEGRNKIDSQPRHIYLYYFQPHQASKFYWWSPRDFILVISMIHLYRVMLSLLKVVCFFSQQNKQKGEDCLQTCSFEIATSFTPKFGSDTSRYLSCLCLAFTITWIPPPK